MTRDVKSPVLRFGAAGGRMRERYIDSQANAAALGLVRRGRFAAHE